MTADVFFVVFPLLFFFSLLRLLA